MNNFLTNDTKAIILLCGFFGKDHTQKPLTQIEYTTLVRWLLSSKMRPEDLLQKDQLEHASIETGLDLQRLKDLLGRGVQLGFSVEEWQRNGIWIISRSDSDYPIRYKKHLKEKAPPLLFGVGDRSLLIGGGLAIVGSRNVDKDGEDFTRRMAELCALNRMPVVSGGARGVDQFAMSAALEAGGITIGILAENLLRKSLERSARYAISDGKLLLLSPYHPSATFSVGTAMARNKLIYGIADYGLVVSAEYKKGGTWAGAEEELKRDISLPVFVRIENNTPVGNSKLIDLGAIPWPKINSETPLVQQLNGFSGKKPIVSPIQEDLFSVASTDFEPAPEIKNVVCEPALIDNHLFTTHYSESRPNAIYEAVIPIILANLAEPITPEQLADKLEVTKNQVKEWLNKALKSSLIVKLLRPVRYHKAICKTESNIYQEADSAILAPADNIGQVSKKDKDNKPPQKSLE